MFKLSSVLLPVVAVSLLVGCSSDDTAAVIDDILNKSSVALTDLSGHTVTYEKVSDKTKHTDGYCFVNELRDETGVAVGDWSVLGNDLTTNRTGGASYTYTTNGTLEKDTTYTTNTADSFKVTNIAETICL